MPIPHHQSGSQSSSPTRPLAGPCQPFDLGCGGGGGAQCIAGMPPGPPGMVEGCSHHHCRSCARPPLTARAQWSVFPPFLYGGYSDATPSFEVAVGRAVLLLFALRTALIERNVFWDRAVELVAEHEGVRVRLVSFGMSQPRGPAALMILLLVWGTGAGG